MCVFVCVRMHALIGLMGEVILHRDQVNEDVNIDVMDISHRKQCAVVLDKKIKALLDCVNSKKFKLYLHSHIIKMCQSFSSVWNDLLVL